MVKSILKPEISEKLAALYQRMEEVYDRVARELHFTCTGCPDNCCDSYFLHHTVIEWAYLWQGLAALSENRLAVICERAADYIAQSRKALMKGERPQIMCPLNDGGLCVLYKHRLMICRMHGVPSCFSKPDGSKVHFPGCFRCQEQVEGREEIPEVDRTELYRELASLEKDVLLSVAFKGHRIKMTIAEMITAGPPQL